MDLQVGTGRIAPRLQGFYAVAAFAFVVALIFSPLGTGVADAKKKRPQGSLGTIKVRVVGLNSVGMGKARITVKQWGTKPRGQKKMYKKVLRSSTNSVRKLKVPRGNYQVMGSPVRLRTNFGDQMVYPRVRPRTFKLVGKRPKRTVTVSYSAGGSGPQGPATIKFNLAGAIGLLTAESGSRGADRVGSRSTSNSNLMALLPSGELREAIESGGPTYGQQIRVKQFVLGPDGAVYVIFEWPVPLGISDSSNPGSPGPYGNYGCVLVRVDRESGEAECVDSELQQVNTWAWSWGNQQEPVQFDAAGSVYYLGYKWSQGGGMPETILRRKTLDGTVTDFISFPNAQVNQFKVSPAGGVLHSGYMNSPSGGMSTPFFRVVTPRNSLKTLSIPGSSENYFYGNGLHRFPNGEVFVDSSTFEECRTEWGSQSCVKPAIYKYSDSSESFSQAWLGSDSINPQHSLDDFCVREGSSASSDFPELCGSGGYYGGLPATPITLAGDRVFRLLNNLLVRIYPDFDALRSSLDSVTTAEGAGSKVVLAGKEAGENVLMAIDVDTGRETTLIPASSEIEVFNVQYSPTENRLYFDGLRYSDNSYIFGSISLDGGDITAERASSGRWQQFQIFG